MPCSWLLRAFSDCRLRRQRRVPKWRHSADRKCRHARLHGARDAARRSWLVLWKGMLMSNDCNWRKISLKFNRAYRNFLFIGTRHLGYGSNTILFLVRKGKKSPFFLAPFHFHVHVNKYVNSSVPLLPSTSSRCTRRSSLMLSSSPTCTHLLSRQTPPFEGLHSRLDVAVPKSAKTRRI